jgi:hypothetical protein
MVPVKVAPDLQDLPDLQDRRVKKVRAHSRFGKRA